MVAETKPKDGGKQHLAEATPQLTVKLVAWLPELPKEPENAEPAPPVPAAPAGKAPAAGGKGALPPAQTLKAAELLASRGLRATFAFGPLPPVEMKVEGDMPLTLAATSQLTVDEALLRQLASSSARLIVKVTQETVEAVVATLDIPSAHLTWLQKIASTLCFLLAPFPSPPVQKPQTLTPSHRHTRTTVTRAPTRLGPKPFPPDHPLLPCLPPQTREPARSRLRLVPRRRPCRIRGVEQPRADTPGLPRGHDGQAVRVRGAVRRPAVHGHEDKVRAGRS